MDNQTNPREGTPMDTKAIATAAAVAVAAVGGGIALTEAPASASSYCYPERVNFKDSLSNITFKVHTYQQCNIATTAGTYASMTYRIHYCDFLDYASYQPGQIYTGAHYGWCT